jgi:hypothetical protein
VAVFATSRPLLLHFLELLSKPPKSESPTPVLERLRGAAKGVTEDAYGEHLDRKYR